MDFWTENLMIGAVENNVGLALLAALKGADLSCADENGNTAAMIFALNNNAGAAMALAGFDSEMLSKQNKLGQNLVMMIASKRMPKMVLRLIELNDRCLFQADFRNMTLAMQLCETRQFDLLKEISRDNMQVYSQCDESRSIVPMYMAAWNEDTSDLLALVQRIPAFLGRVDRQGHSVATILAERDRLSALYHLPYLNPKVLQQPVLRAMLQRIDKQLKSFQVAEVIAMGYPIPGNLQDLLKYHHDVTIEGINEHLALLGHEPL